MSNARTLAITVGWVDESVDGFVGAVGPCTAVGAGRLDGLDKLATELGRSPQTAAGELVAEGYARWGPQLPDRLRGRFAVAAWNRETDTALVAVDRLGAASVFVARRGESLLFATELAPLLRMLESTPPPESSAVVQWLVTGTTPYGRTLYGGVRRLCDGEAMVVTGDRVETRRYWSPRYEEPLTGSPSDLASEIRDTVVGAVRKRFPAPGGTTAIFVSGGLDSGAVAAAASEVAAGEGVTFRGYSASFPDHPAMDESELVLELSDWLDFAVEFQPVQTTGTLTAALGHLQTWRVPSLSPNLHFLHRLAEAARADGASVILDGEGGDELFGLEPFYLADLVRQGRADKALQLARRLPGLGVSPSSRQIATLLWRYGVKGALPGGGRRLAERLRGREPGVPSWLTEPAARTLVAASEEWAWRERDGGPLWWRARIDDLIVQRQRIGASDHLRWVTGFEMRDAHPFLDDLELVELVLRVPPPASYDADFDRPLLRLAAEGLLPDSIRLRKDKTYFNQLLRECLEGPDRHAVEMFVGDRDARVNAYVRPEVVRSLILEAPESRHGGSWALLTWRLLAAETWLRSLEDGDFPGRAIEQLCSQ